MHPSLKPRAAASFSALRHCFLSALAAVLLLAAPRTEAGPSLIEYGGNVVFGSFSTSTMELGGTARGTQYDALNVAGRLTFGGTLDVVLIDGFVPAFGQSFNLYDWGSTAGAFSTVNLPSLGPNLIWNTAQLYLSGTIAVDTTLTPIEQWRLFYFGFFTNTGIAANLFNYDGDGVPNLIQYGLGMNPLIPDIALLPTAGRTTVGLSEFLTLTFTRPLSATDVDYQVEVSGNLVDWDDGSFYSSGGDIASNAFTTEVSRITSGGAETIVVRDNVPIGGAAGRFIRLAIID